MTLKTKIGVYGFFGDFGCETRFMSELRQNQLK